MRAAGPARCLQTASAWMEGGLSQLVTAVRAGCGVRTASTSSDWTGGGAGHDGPLLNLDRQSHAGAAALRPNDIQSRPASASGASGEESSSSGNSEYRTASAIMHAWRVGSTPLPTSARALTGLPQAFLISSFVSPGAFSRAYHPWFYGSKLRNRTVGAAGSLDQLGDMLRHEGDRLDHVNLAAFLQRLQRAAQEAETEARDAVASGGSGRSSSGTAAAVGGSSLSSPSSAVATALSVAASRAVDRQVAGLAAEAAKLVRRRAKWYDPRHAALVVSRTAALRHTDCLMLHELTGRVMARLNEAYSRDLLLLLRGLHQHMQLSAAAAAASPAAAAPPPVAAVVQAAGGRSRGSSPGRLQYVGPPPALLAGVRAFLQAKLPTGRMPPENLEGLLRYLRALAPSRPLGPALCSAVEADLAARMAIYAPRPLAGVLATLASERHPLPAPLLDAAAAQFVAHAPTHGNAPAAARLLAAAAALLTRPDTAAASDAAGSGVAVAATAPGEWISGRPELLAQCLELMTRELPDASLERVAQWTQALARVQAPLASLATASSPASSTASAFLRAHAAAVERLLPSAPPASPLPTRLRDALDALRLPYPRGL